MHARVLTTAQINTIEPRASKSEEKTTRIQKYCKESDLKLPLWGHAQKCTDTEEVQPNSLGHGEERERFRRGDM